MLLKFEFGVVCVFDLKNIASPLQWALGLGFVQFFHSKL